MKISLHQAHSILGVTQAAGEEEVRAAYRKLALRFHPDKNPSPEATAKFQELSAAYKRICDHRARQKHSSNQFRRGFGREDDDDSDEDDDDDDLFDGAMDDLDLDDLTEDDLVDLELSLEEMLSMFEMMFDPSTFDAPIGKRKGAVKAPKPKAKGKSSNGSTASAVSPQQQQQQQRKAGASATGPRVALSRRRRKGPFMGGRSRGADFASFMDDDMRVLEQFMAMSMDDDDLNQMENDLMEDMMQFFMGGDELPGRSRHRKSKGPTPSKVVESDADSDVDEVEEVSDWEDDEPSAADETTSSADTSSSNGTTATPPQLEVGARVRVFGSHAGIIKFIGRVHYSNGEFVGVALDDAVGKNDGTIKGVTYFSCPPSHGIMVRPTDVQSIPSCAQ